MEGDDEHPPAGLQAVHEVANCLVQRVKLIVDGNTDGLERAARGVAVVLAANRLRNRRVHRVHKVERRLHRLFRAVFANHLRNARRPLLLAVIADDAAQLLLAGGIEQIRRSLPLADVHAHIQRRVLMIRESAFAAVKLRGRHAEVKQHAVELGCARRHEKRLAIVEIAVQGVEAGELPQARGRRLNRGHIAVDAVERRRAAGETQHRAAVSAAAERPVAVHAVGLHVHPFEDFLQ